MEPRKIQSKSRYVLAFIIGTLIFVIGFAFTNMVAYLEFQRITNLQDPTSYEIFKDKLEYTLFDEDICSEYTFQKISEDLAYQGQIIGDLETKLGIDNPDVLFRKRFYTLIQLEHFEFVKLINQECDREINSILFFYSNEKDSLEESEKIGNMLGVIYQRNKENLVLYSIDANLDSDIVQKLKAKYDVDDGITIIVNENTKFNYIDNIDEIENILK